MDNFEYNFELLKATREKKKITTQSIAADLCLAERQIISIEQNRPDHFPSQTLKIVCIKKYAKALDLHPEDIIPNLNDIDPTPSLLKQE